MRDDAIRILCSAVELYGGATASAGVDLYSETMYAEGLSVEAVMPEGIYSKAEIERIARYQAGKLRHDDREGFVERVADAAANLVYHGGDRAMMYQGGLYGGTVAPSKSYGYLLYHSAQSTKMSGKYQIRYARVPQGAETCDFCLMLATRGFVYLTEKSAEGWNHTHRDCDCIVVAGVGHQAGSKTYLGGGRFSYTDDWGWVQDTTIEGFDLGAMTELYDAWSKITEADGSGPLSEEARQQKLDAMEQIIGRREW